MPISQPTKTTVPFATSGLKNAIPSTSNNVTGNAGYNNGFPAINMTPTTAGGIPPFGQDFNGILFDLSTAIQYSQAGGNFPYDSAFSTAVGGYPIGAILSNTARTGLWVNIVANNTTNPDSGGAGWSLIGVSGTVSSLNARMSITAASASGAMTADEVVVAVALGGIRYSLPSFSKTINLATTGAGGMDTGTAPVSGFVGIYAIYNPVTGVSALLATNATAAAVPPIYSGGNMPAGFTASALLSVWRTNSSSLMVAGILLDKTHSFDLVLILTSTTTAPTLSALTLASAAPKNAKRVSGVATIIGSTASNITFTSAAAAAGNMGQNNISTAGATAIGGSFIVPVITTQVMWHTANVTAGTISYTINIGSYDI